MDEVAPGRRLRGEGGATAPMVVLAVMALVTLAAVGVLALAYSAAARAVRAAADLVAVSGAQTHSSGGDACDEARRIAGRNDVRLAGCEVTGDLIDFVVEVRVTRGVGWRLPGMPEQVAAVAYAGNVTGLP
ncbi:MAG: flp pilus-assembly TadE/G-like family protein [Micropruina sp.]|uniref:Rv3654c family TadE-like protein n=1 Tax=Micropruina sp. TaxID=2737536 RepID=UPI0039E40C07